jgi:NAD-dependent SIR2 family protein deacetylase
MAIARLERERFPGQLNVVTMNVDGYHQKAGNTQYVPLAD